MYAAPNKLVLGDLLSLGSSRRFLPRDPKLFRSPPTTRCHPEVAYATEESASPGVPGAPHVGFTCGSWPSTPFERLHSKLVPTSNYLKLLYIYANLWHASRTQLRLHAIFQRIASPARGSRQRAKNTNPSFSAACALFVSLFCKSSNVNSFAFMRVRALCKKHRE
jgi:hypothetical protein